MDTAGTILWGHRVGGTSNDAIMDLTGDAASNLYITAEIRSDWVDWDPGPAVDSAGSYLKGAVLWRLAGNGQYLGLTRLHGDGAFSIASESVRLDLQGNIYMSGYFQDSIDLDPGVGVDMHYSPVDWNFFMVKLSNNGAYQWGRVALSPNGYCYDSKLRLDTAGNVYFSVQAYGVFDFDPGPDTLLANGVGFAEYAVLAKWDANGNAECMVPFINTTDEECYAYDLMVANDPNDIYLGSYYDRTLDFDPGPGTAIDSSGPEREAFLLKFAQCIETHSSLSPVSCGPYTSPSGNYTWSISGTYSDTIANALGCDSILNISLTVNTVDTSVSLTLPTLTANATAATYQWLNCDSAFAPVPGETAVDFTPLSSGNYAVEVTQNGCTDTSACYSVLVTQLQDIPALMEVRLYPNPVHQGQDALLRVQMGQALPGAELSVLDAMGRPVYRETLSHEAELEIPTGQWSLGLYGIRLLSPDGELRFTGKFILR